MLGNVAEWVFDDWSAYPGDEPQVAFWEVWSQTWSAARRAQAVSAVQRLILAPMTRHDLAAPPSPMFQVEHQSRGIS